MKAASISQLKQEMKTLSSNDLVVVCLRLIRYKKENKELLTYLLFEMQDEKTYIKTIQEEMEQQFSEINKSNMYYTKKSIRKIVRTTNKFIRYSGKKETEVELLMYFCECLNESGIPIEKSVALNNIYIRQIEKIKKAIGTLHEDLQFDYNAELKGLL
jgi:hypothetical protein